MNLFTAVCIGVLCGAIALVSAAGAGAGEAMVREFRIGKATVWAIADWTGERDLSVFKDADQNIIRQAAPDGKLPTAIMMFAVRLPDRLILIDTGLGNASGDRASRLMAGLASIGLKPADFNQVLITHYHGDHIGGLLWEGKKAFPNARVAAGRVEHTFWLDPASLEKFPSRKANFEQSKKIFGMYEGAVDLVEFGAEAAPGIRAVDSIGHTPGHTAFLLESDGERLLIVGDILHASLLQFPHPEINASYDMIPDQAIAARVRMLEMAASEKIRIAGMHLPFPGIGRVEKIAGGGFMFAPAE